MRKTAAICVAKLYDINPDLVEERGFLDTLRELIGDSNPMVRTRGTRSQTVRCVSRATDTLPA